MRRTRTAALLLVVALQSIALLGLVAACAPSRESKARNVDTMEEAKQAAIGTWTGIKGDGNARTKMRIEIIEDGRAKVYFLARNFSTPGNPVIQPQRWETHPLETEWEIISATTTKGQKVYAVYVPTADVQALIFANSNTLIAPSKTLRKEDRSPADIHGVEDSVITTFTAAHCTGVFSECVES